MHRDCQLYCRGGGATASMSAADQLFNVLCEASRSRVVEMAWEDRTAFEAIEAQFGLNESAVVALMRRYLLPSSFRMWRKRMAGRRTKHAVLRGSTWLRHRANHRWQ